MAVLLYRHAKASTWLAPLLILLLGRSMEAKGGEKATLTLTPLAPTDINHRQDFCPEYDAAMNVSNVTFNFANALSGKQLHVVLQYGDGFKYFNYTPEGGIDPDYPGIVPRLLDYVAEKGNFTWRDSFGVYTTADKGENNTWDDMILWSAETYDLGVDKWVRNARRLEMGIAYCEPWFDASYILVDKITPPNRSTRPDLGNFLKPFDGEVWCLVVATIFFSTLVYQFIEYTYEGREDRSFRRWFMDNLYLSSINFTQNYIYEPKSLAGRIYGFSFSFWAMLMGATYTANLASQLVDRPVTVPRVTGIESALEQELTFCTHSTSASDIYIDRKYGDEIIKNPKQDPADMYVALNNDECDLLVGTKQEYDEFKSLQSYNPECLLEEVSKQIKKNDASFVTRVDPAKCTGLVNEIFTYYLSELKEKAYFDFDDEYNDFDDEWNLYFQSRAFEENKDTPDFACGDDPDVAANKGRRLLRGGGFPDADSFHRTLSTTNNAAASGSVFRELQGGSDDALTVSRMAGTFLLHLVGCVVAILISLASCCERRFNKGRHSSKSFSKTREMSVQQPARAVRLTTQLESLSSKVDKILSELALIRGEEDTVDESAKGEKDKSAGRKKYKTSVDIIYGSKLNGEK